MNLVMRAGSAAVLCTALATSVAACNPTDPAKPAAASGTASAAPSKPAGPLDELSGSEIAQKAIANLKEASTVHYAGRAKDSGQTIDMDITLVSGKGCKGSMTAGKGSVKVTLIGTTMWLKPDRAFWTANGGNDPTVLAMVADKWIKTSKTGDMGSSMSGLCNLNKMLADEVGDTNDLQKGGTTTVNGQPALRLKATGDPSVLDVSDTADPRPLRMTDVRSSGRGTLNFTDYNSPVNLTPPPASETVDGKSIGM
ncbi:hypothetical protein ACFYZJ_35750 [Streptomyces sp. NPDC001848]|uniref:hypothetical protein n=1 Tax=Streptomyces sp. NPDC001848 TaxID=3364618 RepID=UPI00368FB3EB